MAATFRSVLSGAFTQDPVSISTAEEAKWSFSVCLCRSQIGSKGIDVPSRTNDEGGKDGESVLEDLVREKLLGRAVITG